MVLHYFCSQYHAQVYLYLTVLMKKLFISLLLLVLFSILAKGQRSRIIVLDSKSRDIIPFAHVCFQEIKDDKTHYEITDEEGFVINPSIGRSVIVISYMGYQTLIDTIEAVEDLELLLIPDVFDIQNFEILSRR